MEKVEKRHYAVIDAYNRQLHLSYNGIPLANTTQALILKEVGKSVYNPVFYIPKEDILVSLQPDSSYASSCPIKGEATYWTFENAWSNDYVAWSYEKPLPRTKKIAGYVAFNINHVKICSEPL